MKNIEEVIGIDVSKKTLDVTIYHSKLHAVFTNNHSGYEHMLLWISTHVTTQDYFLCFENTGNYSLKLSIYLSEHTIVYVEESPMRIKRSTGLLREKSDKLDSYMIARYGWVYREELLPSEIQSQAHQELGRLLALRDQLVRGRSGLKSTLKEQKHLLTSPSTDVCCKILQRTIKQLDKQVLSLEQQMKELLKEED